MAVHPSTPGMPSAARLASSRKCGGSLVYSLEEHAEARHGLFQYRLVGGVTDAHRPFAAGSEGNARRQSDFGFKQQPLAEIERVARTGDFWKQVERAVGLRHGDARHLGERRQAKIAI